MLIFRVFSHGSEQQIIRANTIRSWAWAQQIPNGSYNSVGVGYPVSNHKTNSGASWRKLSLKSIFFLWRSVVLPQSLHRHQHKAVLHVHPSGNSQNSVKVLWKVQRENRTDSIFGKICGFSLYTFHRTFTEFRGNCLRELRFVLKFSSILQIAFDEQNCQFSSCTTFLFVFFSNSHYKKRHYKTNDNRVE